MRRKEYRSREQVLFSAERDLISEFRELCDKENKSLSLKLNEMIQEELEKNEWAADNPLRINFSRANKSVYNRPFTLDPYIERAKVAETKEELENLKRFAKDTSQKKMILFQTIRRRERELDEPDPKELFFRKTRDLNLPDIEAEKIWHEEKGYHTI